MRFIKARFTESRNHTLRARKYAFAMKKPTTFTERLEEALRLGGKDRQQLADALGITVQAVSQLLLGKTKTMTAENCVRTARLTGVDSFWLATGSGEARGDNASAPQWPFRVTFEEYERLGAEQKKTLDLVMAEFVKASQAVGRDDWGAPSPRGIIAAATPAPTKRQKHG
ncbi:helix-turn-helix transcriptional regulator [Cupriavidus sp.]|uniref:helix-turn-helix domain-containing protein n=1 Tax=Cupriavidus sp. TaxID=1873897 RepID=UPI0025C3D5F6|nr:helix-turn-helix transcriptional regulator [Cupriavidus sp.]MCA3185979.1 helix-turn-helix domain-containing protein [Cupriavidus sp.]MCA3193593.1 helix-turn-helix domain-containing protein [Cupriavidus sp.]MCA3199983.1 helix-turn-helix domain-containing protein [Cupriavidus sp.]MCA3201996.1 helix-turn-helix domain-containing protein [Cupriavidus sp.]MCA3235414.1 helix-turn-helix domain-containing protein [Cupriavidus sp.]